jgi:hypothetical protein
MMKSLSKMRNLPAVLLALVWCVGLTIPSVAQDNANPQAGSQTTPPASAPSTAPGTTPPPPDNGQPPVPAPAFGQTSPVLNPENPPVTGLDQPSLDLRPSSRSFISPAIQVSESADTNGQNSLGSNSDLQSVSRVLGALDLQQFWPKSDLLAEYVGGGAFYVNPDTVKQLQAAGAEAITRWRTGQAALRDAFSYLPDGSFQIGTFGGTPGFGIANLGGMGTGVMIPGTEQSGEFEGVGNIPRLANTAILDGVQAITPVSALTAATGFSNSHYYDPTHTFINSDELTIEGGYTHLIGRHDQLGVVYAFQLIQFPNATGGQIYLHVVNARYSHTISGRLSLVLGAGPEYTELEEGGYASTWSISALARLQYKVGHSTMIASFEKFTSAGQGLYFGSNVDLARFGITRPIGRTWSFYGDLGFSYNEKIQSLQSGLGTGATAGSFYEGFGSAIFRKHLGREWDFVAGYRFSELGFSTTQTLFGSTGKIDQRQIGTIGIEWHPRPTRIE